MENDKIITVDRKFLSDIELLQKASQSKKLVIFVGAGVSLNSDIPNWESLIDELRSDIGINKDVGDALQVAQVYYNEKNHKEYVEKIRKTLLHKKAKYNDLHNILFDLNPEYVITTNYDDLLEQVIKKRALPFSIIKKDTDFPYVTNSNLLVKIHGDLDNDDFVLKEDDYINYEADHPLFEAFIKAIFSTKVVLFVGYSYSDINLKIILQKVKNILGVNYQSSFFLSPGSLSDYKRNYLKNKGVNVLSFEGNKQYIENYLNGENVKNKFFEVSTTLKGPGYSLIRLISFIKHYDSFKENLAKKGILDQIYDSLSRFDQLRSLPFYFIGNLFPFNRERRMVFKNEHKPFVLFISNNEVFDFFKSNTISIADKTYFAKNFLIGKTPYEIEILDKKLDKILSHLNKSGIYYLSNDRNSPRESVLVNLKQVSICKCNQCLFKRGELKDLLANISTLTISDVSNIQDDMSLAFSHYQLGNIYKSYSLFEEIAQKAWHMEYYILYFISKLNIKRLGHMVKSSEYENFNKNILEKLDEKAFNINLDSEFFQINAALKEEAEIIKIIRDDSVLSECKNEINESYEKIYRKYEYNKYTGFHVDQSDEIRNIRLNLQLQIIFHKANFIVNDIFTNFRSTVIKSCQAYIICQISNKNNIDEIYFIDELICEAFINHVPTNEFAAFINQFDIKSIRFTNEASEYLKNTANNYLNSFYKIEDYSDDGVQGDAELTYQVRKGFLDNRFTRIFDNLLFLLSRIELDKTDIDEIMSVIIKFLKIANFIYWNSIKYLAEFIENNQSIIDYDRIVELINIVVKQPKFATIELFEAIASIYENNTSADRIKDEKLINKLIDTVTGQKENTRYKDLKNLLHIWRFSNDHSRENITNILENYLLDNFSDDLYYDLCVYRVIDYTKFFETYVRSVNNDKGNHELHLFSHPTHSGIYNRKFISYIHFLSVLDIPVAESKFDLFDNLEDYMSFYIDPESFNYSMFNVNWLFINSSQYIHKRMSQYKKVRQSFKHHILNEITPRFMKDTYLQFYLDND